MHRTSYMGGPLCLAQQGIEVCVPHLLKPAIVEGHMRPLASPFPAAQHHIPQVAHYHITTCIKTLQATFDTN